MKSPEGEIDLLMAAQALAKPHTTSNGRASQMLDVQTFCFHIQGMSIDTLALARELRAAEMPQAQAEAFAAALGRSFTETIATKSDLAHLEAKIEIKIEQASSRLLLWFIGTNTALAAMLLAAIKF